VDGFAEEFEKFTDRYYKLLPKIILKTPRSVITQMLIRCMDFRNNLPDTIKALKMVSFKSSLKAFTPSISQSLPLFHRSVRDLSEISFDTEKSIELSEKTLGAVIGEEYAVIIECIRAGIFYERGDIINAHEHALIACAKIKDGYAAEIKFCSMTILAASHQALGQAKSAAKMLDDIENMIKRDNAFYSKPKFPCVSIRIKTDERIH